MSSKSGKPFEFEVAVAAMLACPACHGDLGAEGEWLRCVECGRAYPVVDGIPALIAERAEIL